jgi:hypothetical protein
MPTAAHLMRPLLLTLFLTWGWGSSFGQVPLIFDTDMDTDCDDASALAMLHALADAGEVEILATVVSSKYAWSVPCVAAIIEELMSRPPQKADRPFSEIRHR